MTSTKDFTVASARPLPVVLMADVSSSMGVDGKIDALNSAAAEMQGAFAEEDDGRAEIHLAVVTFGGTATLHTPLTSVSAVRWTPMQADGRTPMGAALDLVTDLIEDRERVPSRAYRPTTDSVHRESSALGIRRGRSSLGRSDGTIRMSPSDSLQPLRNRGSSGRYDSVLGFASEVA